MTKCSKCGRKLSFYNKKNRSENGSILCSFCFDDYNYGNQITDEKRDNHYSNLKFKIINDSKEINPTIEVEINDYKEKKLNDELDEDNKHSDSFVCNNTALTILNCLNKINTNAGRSLLSYVLNGSKSQPVFNTKTNFNPYYGALQNHKQIDILDMIDQLISKDYITTYKSDAAFHRPLICLSNKGKDAIQNNYIDINFDIKSKINNVRDDNLYDELKRWRYQKAQELKIPAFVILHNKTLDEISSLLPQTKNELKKVNGLGKKNISSYGDEILDIVRMHKPKNTTEINFSAKIPEKIESQQTISIKENEKDYINLIILAVTKMKGGVCIIGVDDNFSWMRPIRKIVFNLKKEDIFNGNECILKNYNVVNFKIEDVMDNPPHSEDFIVDWSENPNVVSYLNENYIKTLFNKLDESRKIQFSRSNKDEDIIQNFLIQNNRSVVLIKPDKVINCNWINFGRYQPRIKFQFQKNCFDYPCTDLKWRALGRNEENINVSLFNSRQVYFVIGLSRLFKSESKEDYWPLIIGVHTLPDYTSEIDYNNL